ncbi:MAG: hypothetical protein U0174_13795 [Polyangiaceae bacterium]
MTMQHSGGEQSLVSRLRNPPSRVMASLWLFGGMLGAPGLLGVLAAVFSALELEALAIACGAFAFVVFTGVVVLAWVFILRGRTHLQQAEQAYFAGDFMTVTTRCFTVLRTVFRADYRATALYLMALSAEKSGSFEEAARLFTRASDALPAMLSTLSARRVRALAYSHAAINWAALGRVPDARNALSLCHRALGPQQSSLLDAFRMDDSHFGAAGLATLLNELEGRRDPRPLAALAGAFVALRNGDHYAALDMVTRESPALAYGLAPDERALLTRIAGEANMQLGSGDPHRSMARVDDEQYASPWVDAMLARRS